MHIDGHRVRCVTTQDAPAVQALLAQDPVYFERIDGAPLRPDEALEIITERPPGVPPAHKHNFLISRPAGPKARRAKDRRGGAEIDVALLSLIESYPDERTWYLGQIFVAPAARGGGLGTRAIEAMCGYVHERGGVALRLAVVLANTGARRLYERLGFRFIARKPRDNWNNTVSEVDVLERTLPTPTPRRRRAAPASAAAAGPRSSRATSRRRPPYTSTGRRPRSGGPAARQE